MLVGIRRNCLRSGRNRSFYLSIRRAIRQIVVIIEIYHFCQQQTKFTKHLAVNFNSICRWNYRGSWLRRNRSATDHIFCVRQTLEKKWEFHEAVHQLFTDFKKTYCSVRREVLCNILIECGVSMKLIRLIKMCINGTYNRVGVGKHLSNFFPIRNGL